MAALPLAPAARLAGVRAGLGQRLSTRDARAGSTAAATHAHARRQKWLERARLSAGVVLLVPARLALPEQLTVTVTETFVGAFCLLSFSCQQLLA